MKMGNTATRVAIEPTTFAFWASVLTITPCRPKLPNARKIHPVLAVG